MRKLLAAIGLMLMFVGISHAGVPLGQGTNPDSFHLAIYGSSATASGTNIYPVVAAPATNYQNCFTRIFVQLNGGSTFYIMDGALSGGTTVFVAYGEGIITSTQSATVYGSLSLPEQHLEPYCMTASTSTTFELLGTGTGNVVNWEGYTYGGPWRN